MKKIAIFYMIGQFGEPENWMSMYNDQINALKESGLYDKAELIELFVKGQSPISLESISDKLNNITYFGDLEEDRPTNKKLYRAYVQIMQRIWAFSYANPEYKILFFHSLGVSRSNSDIYDRSAQFRKYFEKILIHHWKDCVDILDHYDCAGVEYIPIASFKDEQIEFHAPHYQGFFWWANANYLRRLNPSYFYQDVEWQPYLCELWIGSGNPNAYCFYNTWKNRYFHNIGHVPYDEIIQNTRNIVSNFSKQKIAFVMNSSNKCGVYEYGKMTLSNLQKSNKYEYVLIEASNEEEFYSKYSGNYSAAIWNCGPFDWMINILSRISENDIPQFVITGHGAYYRFPNIKQHFVCNPLFYKDQYISLERPLIKFENLNNNPPKEIIKIGSFGFGGWNKNFTGIVETVNKQFLEPVIINFNISYSDYFEYNIERGLSHIIAEKCRQIANRNVIVNISHEYMDMETTVRFLNSNDINIFLYEDNIGSGISSCVDFALMAEKPIMVNKSNSFKNINWKTELLYEHNTIKEVIGRGLEPTNEFRLRWSNNNIIKTFETEFAKYI